MNQNVLDEFEWYYHNQFVERQHNDVARWMGLHLLLESVLSFNVPGDVCEVGCNKGRTSVMFRKTMDQLGAQKRMLYLYDCFTGMPEMGPLDEGTNLNVCHPGAIRCTPNDVWEHFSDRKAAMDSIEIVKGLFEETIPARLPEKIAFAYLDGDWANSILHPLLYVWPRLSPGGVIVVDDYDFKDIPGAKRATDAFFADLGISVERMWGLVTAFVRKPCPGKS